MGLRSDLRISDALERIATALEKLTQFETVRAGELSRTYIPERHRGEMHAAGIYEGAGRVLTNGEVG